MRSYLAAYVLAAVLCAALVPGARWLAFQLGAVSRPGGRNLNGQVIARLGGLAIAVATFGPLLTLLIVDSDVATFVRQSPNLTLGLVAGGTVLCALGAVDDVRGVRARYKLIVQVLVAVMAYYAGFRVDAITLPFFGPLSMGVFGLPITVVWIVGITNAVNLIDGLDGLAAGVGFFAACTSFVVATLTGDATFTVFVALLMASLMGALSGFLLFNFNPARIYMGDSGSYFLGFLLATSSLMAPLQKASTAVSLLVPMVALGVPIFDTLLSMLRRYLERRPLFSPDRGHIHHRLLDMGVTHKRAVFSLYGVSILLAIASVAIALGRDWEVGLAIFGACAVLFALVRFVGYFDYVHARGRSAARIYDQEAQLLRQLVPAFICSANIAGSLPQLYEALGQLGNAAKLGRLALLSGEQVLFEWKAPQSHAPERVQSRFRTAADTTLQLLVPHTEYQLRLKWNSDVMLSAQSELLVQLLADSLGQAIHRLTQGNVKL